MALKKSVTPPLHPDVEAMSGESPALKSVAKAESGTAAAIERLNSAPKWVAVSAPHKPRDYDAEARGKTLCALYEAASASPALAGLKFKNVPELFELQKELVTLQFKEIFPNG